MSLIGRKTCPPPADVSAVVVAGDAIDPRSPGDRDFRFALTSSGD
ncbi:hypothetical protein D3OALGA1CA_2105 [Olavius algarvensis associated proteobacterium Delta 3]|nr:hypothetical protein D3OALGA1CA_2105 [Olavius algarvensis associated proteobacterium Delta 3]CAB5121238.1 hypothetical protein D3OALGB2SA_2999 [Olavius algarvensis associated proteobacterium Delta 3]